MSAPDKLLGLLRQIKTLAETGSADDFDIGGLAEWIAEAIELREDELQRPAIRGPEEIRPLSKRYDLAANSGMAKPAGEQQ